MLPLYLYDHSGITISTSPFSCHWDSGRIGCVLMTRKQAIEVYGERWTEEELNTYMESMVETYDDFLTGEVYTVKVKDREKGEIIERYGSIYLSSEHKQNLEEYLDEEFNYLWRDIPTQLEFQFMGESK